MIPRHKVDAKGMITPIKRCNCCGRIFVKVPETTTVNDMGYWFNCECKSTMFIRVLDKKFTVIKSSTE